MKVSIKKAQFHHAHAISEMAQRSKAHWGYDDNFLSKVKGELTYQADDFKRHPTFVASVGDELMGFYQLIVINSQTIELEALFVDPPHIGSGLGTLLFAHAVCEAQSDNYQTMKVQSDPYAADFYRKQGCIQVGKLASLSIPGRMLPLFEYALS